MMKIALNEFLGECTTRDPAGEGLRMAELYGLYVSWCALKNTKPVSQGTLAAAVRGAGNRPTGRGPCPGMAMTGPAARDYIVHRELPLYALEPSGAQHDPPAAQDSPPALQGTDRARAELHRRAPTGHRRAA